MYIFAMCKCQNHVQIQINCPFQNPRHAMSDKYLCQSYVTVNITPIAVFLVSSCYYDIHVAHIFEHWNHRPLTKVYFFHVHGMLVVFQCNYIMYTHQGISRWKMRDVHAVTIQVNFYCLLLFLFPNCFCF